MTRRAEKAQPQEGEAAVTLHVQTGSRVGVGRGCWCCLLPPLLTYQTIHSRTPAHGMVPATFRIAFFSVVAWKYFHRQSRGESPT